MLSAILLRAVRFESHQPGHVASTKAHLPVVLKAGISVEAEANARQLERHFKTGSGKAFASKRFWRTASRRRPMMLSI
ncbi:excinuclease ABC subunit C [Mesorhizobium sp. SEMIA 3007]|nr:excinuclease ABC subunit C [Mesorhizobium sp. SEMIA 3007]